MADAKHTPGPWLLTGETDGWTAHPDANGISEYRAVKDADGRVIALVVACDPDHHAQLDTETNGLVLAAAADMLRALEVLENAFGAYATTSKPNGCKPTRYEVNCRQSAAMGMARAAIAKATGSAQ